MQTIPKKTLEKFYVSFLFEDDCVAGENISSVSLTAVAYKSGEDEIDAVIETGDTDISETTVRVRVKGGESGSVYKIGCKATTSLGNIFHKQFLLKVQD